MKKKTVIPYCLSVLLAAALVAGGMYLDVRRLLLDGVLMLIARIIVIVLTLIWLTWFGRRPAAGKRVFPWIFLALVPIGLQLLARMAPLAPDAEAVAYFRATMDALSVALCEGLLIRGVGVSLTLDEKGNLLPGARILLTLLPALMPLAQLFVTPADWLSLLFDAVFACALGAFLLAIYLRSGKLLLPTLIHFAVLFAGGFFDAGTHGADGMAGPVLCGILYALNVLFLFCAAYCLSFGIPRAVLDRLRKRQGGKGGQSAARRPGGKS